MAPAKKFWSVFLTVLAIAGLLAGAFLPISGLAKAQATTAQGRTTPPHDKGPFTGPTVYPTVFNGDLRDLVAQKPTGGGEMPEPKPIGQPNEIINPTAPWVDPVAQTSQGNGQMPNPIMNFEGLDINDGGGWHPPDTNGDVGPNHYIQVVNIAIGIYDKTTGAELVNLPYNTFFQLAPAPCNTQNRGDVVVLYDDVVNRWLVTDFSLPSTGPVYECIAVSQSGENPVSGGWIFYAMIVDSDGSPWHDYPKLGVWADGWYMTANMFDPWMGSYIFALDRAKMIAGLPFTPFEFHAGGAFGSLLPGNLKGELPPAGAPEYFANVEMPNILNIWQLHMDWDNPANSQFTGPVQVEVANFAIPDWTIVPQKGTTQLLDTLGDRLMMQLQYRNINGVEALFATHAVVSGFAIGERWYEIRDPGSSPFVYQQGTYQPDSNYRWMGSIAADGEGNIALGYSVSSTNLFPAIRYTGRLAGEIPNVMTQGEAELIAGTGSQTSSNRWGDYSAMSVDPVDDCTFWYTTEYFASSGGSWHTRIGSFKFPSCGVEKGIISGFVYNSVTNQPIAGVPVFATGAIYNYSTFTNAAGFYKMPLINGSYDLVAGPLPPGYPGTDTANGVIVAAPDTTPQDFYLDPVPSLAHAGTQLDDNVLYGNNNGFPEPGEQDMLLSEVLFNQGTVTSTLITSKVTSLTPGVTVGSADSTYADIATGITGTNTSPYVFSIDPSVACDTDLQFEAVITDSVNTYNTAFSLNASVPLPRQNLFLNDVEGGAAGWTAGGSPSSWAITANQSHSPTHSWTDSPSGQYGNYVNNWVRTPVLNLSDKHKVQLEGWFKYDLESGWDYAYVEYSLNGGSSWNPVPLATFTGSEGWHLVTMDASMLDHQPNVALRIHMTSDSNTTYDGIYVDDVALSYEPYECSYVYEPLPNAPVLLSPADGSLVSSPVTFTWEPGDGGAPAEGYIFYFDHTPVITYTTPITSATFMVSLGPHTWSVKATNPSGVSLPSPTWSFDVIGKFFLPLINR